MDQRCGGADDHSRRTDTCTYMDDHTQSRGNADYFGIDASQRLVDTRTVNEFVAQTCSTAGINPCNGRMPGCRVGFLCQTYFATTSLSLENGKQQRAQKRDHP